MTFGSLITHLTDSSVGLQNQRGIKLVVSVVEPQRITRALRSLAQDGRVKKGTGARSSQSTDYDSVIIT